MTALSELLPAGGAGKVMDFVASGTLPNGQAVVLKSDGTVEVVGETSVAESIPAGSESVFNTSHTTYISLAFDPNTANKFVVTYNDSSNSDYGTAIVGTVSGTSLSFGSKIVFNSATTYDTSVSFDPNTANKFVVTYKDVGNANYGAAVVGTVSGTTISFGSEVVFNAGNTVGGIISFDPNTAGKFVVAYQDYGNSYYGIAVVGTEYVFHAANATSPSVTFDPNTAGKFVVVYADGGSSYYGTVVVGTVSGTAISYGTKVIFESGSTSYSTTIAFDPSTANKFVVVYRDNGNGNSGTAIVGTVSGTSVSFGSEVVFNTGNSSYPSVSFDPNNAGKFAVVYRDAGNTNSGTAVVGTVSGTSITFGSEYVFNAGNSPFTSIAFDPASSGKFVVAYNDDSNSQYGTAIVGQLAASVTNLTASNFVGITSKAISDTATGSITLQGGVSTNQSSLTSGSTYYVQADGTVSTVSTAPAVNIGKALNATTLKLKGLSV